MHTVQIVGVPVPAAGASQCGHQPAALAALAVIRTGHDRSYAVTSHVEGFARQAPITARSGSRQGPGPQDFHDPSAVERLEWCPWQVYPDG
jgi:hypothetical protein